MAVLKTDVMATPITKKNATSRKSAVADWMESRSFRGKLAVATMLLKSCDSPAGEGAMLKPPRRGDELAFVAWRIRSAGRR
jgi:hypothetical protein